MQNNKNTLALIDLIVEAIEDVKGDDIKVLDLTEIDNAIANYFIICSGNTNTQVKAISGSIRKKTSKNLQEKPWHTEGEENSEWILMDYISVVVHVFQKPIREYYNIEELWADAKLIKN
ncbi:MAG: ribosome silencing factor [Flavobacteriaceae bacterium]|nr:MAG: ribosome silencing factor [Flavobacteriaceae bacterium]